MGGKIVQVHVESVTTTVTKNSDGSETKTSTTTVSNAKYDLSNADAPRYIPNSANQGTIGSGDFYAPKTTEAEVAKAAGGYSRLYDGLANTIRSDGLTRFLFKAGAGTVYSFSIVPEIIEAAVHTAAEAYIENKVDEGQYGSK